MTDWRRSFASADGAFLVLFLYWRWGPTPSANLRRCVAAGVAWPSAPHGRRRRPFLLAAGPRWHPKAAAALGPPPGRRETDAGPLVNARWPQIARAGLLKAS